MPEHVITLLSDEWSRLEELCAGLADGQWRLPTDCPGWSVADQLAHVIGTEAWLAGETPPAPIDGVAHVKNPIGAANEGWVESLRNRSGPEVLERFRAVTATRRAQLAAKTTEELDAIGWTPMGQAPYREFMNMRVMDCWVHEQDIRRAVGRPGHLTGPIVEHSIGRFAAGMPMVVGKRAGAPEGSTVVFLLRGAAPRQIGVAVQDGRARLVDPVPASPTVVVELDAETWWLLALGRCDAAAVRSAGGARFEGDADLGERIVDGMAFMI